MTTLLVQSVKLQPRLCLGLKNDPRAANLIGSEKVQSAEFLVENPPAGRYRKRCPLTSDKKCKQLIDAIVCRNQRLIVRVAGRYC